MLGPPVPFVIGYRVTTVVLPYLLQKNGPEYPFPGKIVRFHFCTQVSQRLMKFSSCGIEVEIDEIIEQGVVMEEMEEEQDLP